MNYMINLNDSSNILDEQGQSKSVTLIEYSCRILLRDWSHVVNLKSVSIFNLLHSRDVSSGRPFIP